VVGTSSFSAGFKYAIDDGTGRIVLLLWHDVFDDCWDADRINLGALVHATGEIALYEGELQLQPRHGSEVKAVEEAAAWAPPTKIGSLTGSDVDQRVMIEGRVVRVEGFSSAVRVFLADDTGETLVLIWRNVLDRIAHNTGLGTPGTLVRVVGTIGVYRSNLEVVPALPVDVLVLDMPENG
jgi:DNA/RNA endonuclease YhcR with UshA esterase domain